MSKESLETKLSEVGDEISTDAVELAVSRLRRRLQAFETGVALETNPGHRLSPAGSRSRCLKPERSCTSLR